MINGILGFISGNEEIDSDTDDRWGISVFVHQRDTLDKRQAKLMLRSQEISQEEDAAMAAFKSTFDDIQTKIGIHKAAIVEFEVISYSFQVSIMQLYRGMFSSVGWSVFV